MALPGAREAIEVASRYLDIDVYETEHLTTGLCHRVFLVTSHGGERVVVRMASPSSREDLEGGVYWSPKLREIGVPTPRILALAIDHEPPSVILEHFEGRDLGDVYASMTSSQRREVALEIASYQNLVGDHFEAYPQRFGYLTLPTPEKVASLDTSWGDVIARLHTRSLSRLATTNLLDEASIESFVGCFDKRRGHLDALEPRAFLHDTTTKNVLIDKDGGLCGVVDTDSLCFGDPILPMALTHVSLTYRGLDCERDYVLPWFEAMGFGEAERWRLDFYRALVAIDFISELGQTFNSEAPIPIDEDHAAILRGILTDALAVLS